MTRAFSDRLVGVVILGAVLSLSRLWLPALFELIGDVRWGGGFVIVAGIEIIADLVVGLAAAGVIAHVVDQPGGIRSTGTVDRVAGGAAVGVVAAIILRRFLTYSLLEPIYTPVFVLHTVSLAVLVGTFVVARFANRGVDGETHAATE
ncbi:MAG: hypothetical protein R6V31_03805 [Halohasta sp.]